MSKIWTYSRIKHTFMNRGNGWDEAIPFTGLSDLIEQIRSKCSPNSIDTLAIVAHGDTGGYVDILPPLTTDNIATYAVDLNRLRTYLQSGAKVLFLACQVAGGKVGDQFLRKFSSILAGCTVVGYIRANEAFGPQPGLWKVFSENSTRSDEWSEEAKWARNGSIIRPPLFEVLQFQQHDRSKKNHCGSRNCRGHSKIGDRCESYQRVAWFS